MRSTRGMYTSHWGFLRSFLLLLLLEGGFTSTTVVVQAFTWHPRGRAPTVSSSSSSECLFVTANFGRCTSIIFAAPKDDNSKPNKGPQKKLPSPLPSNKTISHLANDANLSSLTKDCPTWDQNIAALLEYKEINGTVNLPVHSKKYPNLGQWVHNLRGQKGRLTTEQIQQLDDMRFLWKDSKMEKEDKIWHEMFTKLKAYKEKWGDCRVSTLDKANKKLGKWVSFQRTLYRQENLGTDRIEMLESIGFEWKLGPGGPKNSEIWEEQWMEKFEELIEFKEEHNHTNVPHYFPQNEKLGNWVHRQRMTKTEGDMKEHRRKLLDKIGFTWDFADIYEASWLAKYEELKTYKQELASYEEMMEKRSEGGEPTSRPVLSLRLQVWTAWQRTEHARGNLDPQRKDMLDKIGFEWWE